MFLQFIFISPCLPPPEGYCHCNLFFSFVGITQEQINQLRAAPEQAMIGDITEIITAGLDLNRSDAQGATLVSHSPIVSLLVLITPGGF